jgi:hypothetical protein
MIRGLLHIGKTVKELFSGKEAEMEKKELTNQEAAIIGTKAGIGPIILILLFALPSFGLYGIIVAIVVSLPGILIGIVVAIAANTLIKSSTATWAGGILGAILGIALWIFSSGVFSFCSILGGC